MKTKNILCLLLAVAMILSMAACGGSSANSSTAATTAAAAETAETVAETAAETADPLASLNGQFRVGMECAYAPNNWQESEATDSNWPIDNVDGGYADGYDVQWAKIIADSLGLELVIIKMDWDGLIEALNQGQIDAIIAGMMDTPARKEAINFSSAYHKTEYGMMVNEGSAYENAVTIQDFSGAAVLGQRDTALDTVIDQIEGVNHLTAVASVPDQIARLQQGACDAIVVNVENSAGYMAANPSFRLIRFAEGDGFELPAQGSCVGLRKSDTDLLDMVNAAIDAVDDAARETMWETAVANQPV